jgi:hypothetical protein
MARSENGQKGGQSGGRKGDVARGERLRAALRENLKRRKLQAKARADRPAHDSAGFLPDKTKD